MALGLVWFAFASWPRLCKDIPLQLIIFAKTLYLIQYTPLNERDAKNTLLVARLGNNNKNGNILKFKLKAYNYYY